MHNGTNGIPALARPGTALVAARGAVVDDDPLRRAGSEGKLTDAEARGQRVERLHGHRHRAGVAAELKRETLLHLSERKVTP